MARFPHAFRSLLCATLRFSLFLLTLAAPAAWAQTPTPADPKPAATVPEIRPVSADDFAPTAFAADTGAAAVVLSDRGHVFFENNSAGFRMRFNRVRRVKILREDGLEEATGKVRLYHRDGGREEIVSLKGAAWNMDGGKLQKTETKSGATTVHLSEHLDERRLTLTGVRVGAVVEISYSVISDFFFTLPTWYFEEEDRPVRRSEMVVEIPDFMDYGFERTAYRPFAVEEHKPMSSNALRVDGMPVKGNAVRWVMLDAPAFRDEPFLSAATDWISHVSFQLRAANMPGVGYRTYTTTWPKANAELLLHPRFGGVLGDAGALTKTAKALRTSEPDVTARARKVVALVRESVAWNGIESLYATSDVGDLLRQRKGNSADVNLLLVSALRTAGIPAEAVALSTREHGTVIEEMPLLNRFNYVLALAELPDAPGGQLLDATAPYAAFEMLPEGCLNTRGRVMASDEARQRWVDVGSKLQYATFTTGVITPDATGGTKAALRTALSGYAGQRARTRADGQTPEQLATHYLTPAPGARLTNAKLTRPTDLTAAVIVEAELTEAPEAGAAPPKLLFVSAKDFGGYTENPFRTPERRFPVDLGAGYNESLMLEVTVPEGYEIETVPSSMSQRSPDSHIRAQFRCTPAPDGRSVQIQSALLLSRPAFSPAEYPALRQMYAAIVAKHAEPLVLKKK